MIAPLVLGQLPIVVNGTPVPAPPGPAPIVVNSRPGPALMIVERKPSLLGAPIEKPAEPRFGVLEILPAVPEPALPQPLPGPTQQSGPDFEIEVLPPEPLPTPPPQPLPAPPQEPALEIEEEEIEPATFGEVVGMGPAPAPTWIGPGDDLHPMPEEAFSVVELSSFEPLVSFRRPLVGIPDDPADDGILLHLIQRTSAPPQVQEREVQEQPAPQRPVVTPTWPGYRFPVAPQYRRLVTPPAAAPQRPAAPLGSRVYEWMIWPVQFLTEPFRDY
jgi:hypothetical protein